MRKFTFDKVILQLAHELVKSIYTLPLPYESIIESKACKTLKERKKYC